jgi:uncharacterized protein YeaO (DUF488 family)
MPLYTSYLGMLKKAKFTPANVFPNALVSTEFLYVMRNRGNNAVAPSKSTLQRYKTMQRQNKPEAWNIAKASYLSEIRHSQEALEWMLKVAEKCKHSNVVLVCYEKDADQCHRKLLAQEMTVIKGLEYKGELKAEDIGDWKEAKKRIKCLVFRIRRRYFEQIVMGTKTIEYRRDSPFWQRRIKGFDEPSAPPISYIAVFVCGKSVHRRPIVSIERIKTPSTFSEQGKKDVDTLTCLAFQLGQASNVYYEKEAVS